MRGDRGGREFDDVCHFCHKRGHWKKDCAVRQARGRHVGTQGRPVACACQISGKAKADHPKGPVPGRMSDQEGGELPDAIAADPALRPYLPFMSKGHVSLVGHNDQVPVIVLRDTGAFDSFILSSVLPFSEETDTGSVLPVLGTEMSNFFVPVHRLVLHTALFDGEVEMGLRQALPFEGIAVVLGNDVCGDRVFALQSAQPIVVSVPIGSEDPDENERQFPEVFTACAVTHAMNRGQ